MYFRSRSADVGKIKSRTTCVTVGWRLSCPGWDGVKLSHRGNRETWESEAVMMMIRGGGGGCCSLVDMGSFFIRTINQQVCSGLELFLLG